MCVYEQTGSIQTIRADIDNRIEVLHTLQTQVSEFNRKKASIADVRYLYNLKSRTKNCWVSLSCASKPSPLIKRTIKICCSKRRSRSVMFAFLLQFLCVVGRVDRRGKEEHRRRACFAAQLSAGAHRGQQAVRSEFCNGTLRAFRLHLFLDVCVLLRRDSRRDPLSPKPAHSQPIRQGIHAEAGCWICLRASHHGDGANCRDGLMIRLGAR